MSGPAFNTRAPGWGRVEFEPSRRQKYGVYTPGNRTSTGARGTLICRCETRYAAEKALLAWYVVGAVVIMASLGGECAKAS